MSAVLQGFAERLARVSQRTNIGQVRVNAGVKIRRIQESLTIAAVRRG